MTDLNVVLKAAELIVDGRKSFACDALMKVSKDWPQYRRLRNQFTKLMGKENEVSPTWWNIEDRDSRVLGLLLYAEVLRDTAKSNVK